MTSRGRASSTSSRAAEVAGRRALDVGCGGGLVTEALHDLGASATGIDAGEKPLAVARLHALERGIGEEITYTASTPGVLSRGNDQGNSALSPAWRCWSTCLIHLPPCRHWQRSQNPAGMLSSPPSTARPRRGRSPSSAPNMCLTCCPRARIPTKSSSARRNWRAPAAMPDSWWPTSPAWNTTPSPAAAASRATWT